MKILVIEDDAETASFLANGLQENGHAVDLAANGRDGLFLSTSGQYDVAVVDRMLPQLDGLSLVKAMRSAGVVTPVLFLSTMGGIDDRVTGLDAGGDDYLIKPFAFTELLARVNALHRRPAMGSQPTILEVGDLRMDLLKRKVTRQGKSIDLQPREFRLLQYLMQNADKVVTRTMLLEAVWDFHFDPQTSVVETHISRLRAKVDRGFDRELIHTARGVGYCLRD
jgi:two-component system, OmpR family, response regulator